LLLFKKHFGFFLGGYDTLLGLRLRNAAPPDVGVCVGQGRGDENYSQGAALVSVEPSETRELYAIFGLTRQS
jgi:hypothetical protein